MKKQTNVPDPKKIVFRPNIETKKSASKESIASITSVPSSKQGPAIEESKSKKRVLSFFDKMKNVKNLASSFVSTVQDKVSRIDEVIGDPLLQVTGIKDNKSDRKGKVDRGSSKSSTSPPQSKLGRSPITWKINKHMYELTETKRKKQMKRCLQVTNFQFEHPFVQHKNSITCTTATSSIVSSCCNTDKSCVSSPEHKLFNNQFDQLTDYELSEVLKKMCLTDKFKFRRVSKRFRNCINQIVRSETAFAVIEKKMRLSFRIDQITSPSVDPIYMNKNDLNNGLIQNINKFMTRLNSIIIAYPIEFEMYLNLIRRRNLSNLVLCGSTFINKHMNALPDYTVNLTTLNLDQCDIDDKGLEVIVRECGKVLNLRLSHCNQINGTFLEYLPPNFACLEISNCRDFKAESWRFFLAKDRKQITTFSIDNIPFNSVLIEAMMKFDKLSTLKLAFRESGDYKFRNIAMYTRLEMIKIVDYSNPPSFNDAVFNEIQRGCDRLTRIELEFDPSRVYLTDNGFCNLYDDCGKVSTVKLINLCSLTDKALASLSRLKYLLEITLDNSNLTDAVLIKSLPDFKSLQKIKFYRCSNITNHLPEQLFKSFFTRPVWYYLSMKSNPKIEYAKINQSHKPLNVIFECSN